MDDLKRLNPWQTKSSKVIYSNPWITVREDQVITPNGQNGIYGVVEPKGFATGVLALTADQQIYLVGQYRYPTCNYSWEIPEGGAQAGENPLDAAKRELLEETGITAAIWQELGGIVHTSNCFTSEVGYLYLATEITEGQSKPDPTEKLAVRKLPVREAILMADSGEITDSLSLIGLMRLAKNLS